MSYTCTLDLAADTLSNTLEIDVISELYFGITRKVIKYFSLLFDEDSEQVHIMYQYIARLHYHLTSLGMVSFLDDEEFRVKLKCLALIYEEDGELADVSFRGYTYLSDLLKNHPKMSLDLLVKIAEESIKALQTKINPRDTSTNCFIQMAKDIYTMVSRSPEVTPHFVNHVGSPRVVVRLKVSPRRR
jgi:hypothetical protein